MMLLIIMVALAGYQPALFTNTAAPLLVPLSAPNPSSFVRKHSYGLFLRNLLQTKAQRNHHSDS